MDDLLSEDWRTISKPTTTAPPNASAFASNYSSLRASPQLPQSGSSTPASLSRPSSTVNGAKSPANDSFGNLLSLKPQKAGNSLSMQERQKQLIDEKRRQQEQQAQLWDSLGSGRGTPEVRQPSPAVHDNEDDILAAFNKDAPVNKASYFAPPPPSGPVSGRSTPAVVKPPASSAAAGFDYDDDPFGLNEVARKSNGHVTAPKSAKSSNDDDILGDLGKPVAGKPRQQSVDSMNAPMIEREDGTTMLAGSETNGAPADRALAELVDMGFPADTARIALAENGGNVQNAVGWLLHQAHEESRQKARGETPGSRSPQPRLTTAGEREAMPAWMRTEERSSSATRGQEGKTQNGEEYDAVQTAQQLGAKFFKSANSLWKASQKQMAKTISEFQQEGDSNQPKWMREPTEDATLPSRPRRPSAQSRPVRRALDVTDEAAMLDAPREKPQPPPKPSRPSASLNESVPARSPVEPLPQRQPPQPRFMQQPSTLPDKRPTTKLSKQDVEDQVAQAYVSPARRKRPTPKPEPQSEPQVDLFSPPLTNKSSISTPTAPFSKPNPSPAITKTPPAPTKPQSPPRNVPTVSATALSTSASHRKAGGEHFKRGDYSAAHESYTAALTPLPPTHPIAIIVLSNRALTALKTGDAKLAVTDADRAIQIIGPGLGANETIDLGAGEGVKSMKEFYGKAIMRKAEALEHLEKYPEAAAVWRQAVEAGVGGNVSLRGKDRCEKAATPTAAAPKPVRNTTPAPVKAPPPKSLGNSLTRPTISTPTSREAVKKLRLANAEADKVDDEKFALADIVDARLTAWRGGKTDNLRALLQSMDAVLWDGAGWKKVGMSDLVIPAKVKIVYMKAIAKVHPDKIPQDATTEQRMVSAAVFATLNEAWDKFKRDNNL